MSSSQAETLHRYRVRSDEKAHCVESCGVVLFFRMVEDALIDTRSILIMSLTFNETDFAFQNHRMGQKFYEPK